MLGPRVAFLIFTLLVPGFILANVPSGQKATQIFSLIYNQQFSQANQMLEAEKQTIGSLYYGILSIDLAWWRYITTNSPTDLEAFLQRCDETKIQNQEVPDEDIIRLVGLNYLMRFEMKEGNYLKAGLLHLKIKPLIRQTDFRAATPGQASLYKLYQVLFYYFEKKYIPFSTNPEGLSRAGALEALHNFCSDEDWIVSSLANYFIGKIYLEIEKQPQKGTPYFRTLTQRFPSNRIFSELLKDSATRN